MITIKEACDALLKEAPEFRIMGCSETKDYFFFHTEPRRWDGNGAGAAGGEGFYVSKKDGIVGTMTNNQIIDIFFAEGFPTKHDVTPFLSEEDVAFLKKVMANRAS